MFLPIFPMLLMLVLRMNPDDSFLALRIFNKIMLKHTISCSQFENMLESIAELISTSPDEVEMDELKKILEKWLDCVFRGRYFNSNSTLLSKPYL